MVLMPADSANGQSSVTMQLWLEPELITTDLTGRSRNTRRSRGIPQVSNTVTPASTVPSLVVRSNPPMPAKRRTVCPNRTS